MIAPYATCIVCEAAPSINDPSVVETTILWAAAVPRKSFTMCNWPFLLGGVGNKTLKFVPEELLKNRAISSFLILYDVLVVMLITLVLISSPPFSIKSPGFPSNPTCKSFGVTTDKTSPLLSLMTICGVFFACATLKIDIIL